MLPAFVWCYLPMAGATCLWLVLSSPSGSLSPSSFSRSAEEEICRIRCTSRSLFLLQNPVKRIQMDSNGFKRIQTNANQLVCYCQMGSDGYRDYLNKFIMNQCFYKYLILVVATIGSSPFSQSFMICNVRKEVARTEATAYVSCTL